MKKKILTIVLCFSLALSVGVLCGFTYEAEQGEPETEVEQSEKETWATRFTEWAKKYKGQITSIVGDTVIGSFMVFLLVKSRKKLSPIALYSSATHAGQSEQINATNKLIEEYNGLSVKLNEYEKRETERETYIKELSAMNKAVVEILFTVYGNAKNLPQSVKDVINVKYADALKKCEVDTEE